MIYVDTSLVISYMDLRDPNHDKAVKLIEAFRSERYVVSMLVLVELASVYSRAMFEKPLELALYSLEKVGAKLVKLNFDDAVKQAFKLASILRLRTLDLLHISACKSLGADKLITFDHDVLKKAETITKTVGLKIVGV